MWNNWNNLWQRPGVVHLDLSAGGGGFRNRKELLLGIGLGAVVLISVGLIIYGAFIKDPVGAPTPRMLHMACTECGHDFEMNEKDQPWEKLQKAYPRIRPSDYPRADCPKCGGDLTCVEARQCPKCGAYFAPPQTGEIVCPKCGVDVGRYVSQQH